MEFEDKKQRGRTKVLKKAAKIVLKKTRYEIKEDLKKIALTTVSKLSLKQVHEKRRLESPEFAKPCYGKPFLDECPKYFFSCLM